MSVDLTGQTAIVTRAEGGLERAHVLLLTSRRADQSEITLDGEEQGWQRAVVRS